MVRRFLTVNVIAHNPQLGTFWLSIGGRVWLVGSGGGVLTADGEDRDDGCE